MRPNVLATMHVGFWIAFTAAPAMAVQSSADNGPGVPAASASEAGLVRTIHTAFRAERAFTTIQFTDGFYRAPANDGFEAVLDHLLEQLRAAGYSEDGDRFQLEVIETPRNQPAWTPKRGRLVLEVPGEEPVVLHAFDDPGGRDRVMLPVNAPSASVRGPIALSLDDVKEGSLLVTEESAGRAGARAKSRGAVAVLSSRLQDFNVDPTEADRHLDAILFTSVFRQLDLPVGMISPRSLERICAAVADSPDSQLAFEAEVTFARRPLRTVVARIVGGDEPGRAVAIASHVQEPGACDNASGVGGTLETARCLVELIRADKLPVPKRTIVFIFGDEMTQSRIWLEHTELEAIAGISVDMVGESREKTGAIALLERSPDPGAVHVLPPDRHTRWGASPVAAKSLKPNGLSVLGRLALADVAALEPAWQASEHPWEGGSDHDIFLRQGIPAVLFWHFTDFTYHTSLDRLDMVDPAEVRRTMVAVALTAWRLAAPDEATLERALKAVGIEEALRLQAANKAKNRAALKAWRAWNDGAKQWLRRVFQE